MYSIYPENGILLEHVHLCSASACRRGSHEGVTVSDPINTLHSLNTRKVLPGNEYIVAMQLFPLIIVTNTGDSLLRKRHKEAREETFRFKVEITC